MGGTGRDPNSQQRASPSGDEARARHPSPPGRAEDTQQRCDARCSHREPSCPQEHPDGEQGTGQHPEVVVPRESPGARLQGASAVPLLF